MAQEFAKGRFSLGLIKRQTWAALDQAARRRLRTSVWRSAWPAQRGFPGRRQRRARETKAQVFRPL